MKKIFLALLFASLTTSVFATSNPLGGDRDLHGCIGSADYLWSAPMKACIRTWEYYDISIDTLDTGDKKLDMIIQRKINRLVKDFRREAEVQITEFSLTGKTNFSLDITPVIENSGSIISVRLNTYTFLGGAHGTAMDYTWNYDVKKGSLLSLLKVITKKELMIISKNASKELLGIFPDADKSWINEGLSPRKLSNYQNFTIHTDSSGKMNGLIFYFADYQIGPHAYGMQILKINLGDMSVKVIQ